MSRADEGRKVLNSLLKEKRESGALTFGEPSKYTATTLDRAKKSLAASLNDHTMDAAMNSITAAELERRIKQSMAMITPSEQRIVQHADGTIGWAHERNTQTATAASEEATVSKRAWDDLKRHNKTLQEQNKTLQAHNKAQAEQIDNLASQLQRAKGERNEYRLELEELKALINETDFT